MTTVPDYPAIDSELVADDVLLGWHDGETVAVKISDVVAYLNSLGAPEGGYKAELSFDAALGVSERFGMLMMPAAVRFSDDFAGGIGVLLGTAPAASEVINVRHYLADGSGGSIIGTVTIGTDRSVVLDTTASGNFDTLQGDVLAFEGPSTAQAATEFVMILKGVYL